MGEFLSAILQLPTVVYTGLLACVCFYWALVMAGALELDGGDLSLDLSGGDHSGILDGVLAALGLREVLETPVSVRATAFSFFGWMLSFLGMYAAGKLGLTETLRVPVQLGVAVLSVLGGALAAGFAVKPLAPLFRVHASPTRSSLAGRTCRIVSLEVSGTAGRAEIHDGGAGIVAPVRCDHPNALTRGADALVVEYDEKRGAYVVEPLAALLDSGDHRNPTLESTDDVATDSPDVKSDEAVSRETEVRQSK